LRNRGQQNKTKQNKTKQNKTTKMMATRSFLTTPRLFSSLCLRNGTTLTYIPLWSPISTTQQSNLAMHLWRRTFAAPAKPAGKGAGGKPGGKPVQLEEEEFKEIVDNTPFSIDSLVGREDNPLLSSTPELRRAVRDLLSNFTEEELMEDIARAPSLVTFKEFLSEQVLPTERR